jgi:hypothetical protein
MRMERPIKSPRATFTLVKTRAVLFKYFSMLDYEYEAVV